MSDITTSNGTSTPGFATRPSAVAVYCASSLGKKPVYRMAAESLGKALAKNKRRLVYGGGSTGIMGVVSSSTLDAGGEVTGVIPYAMYIAGGEKDKTGMREDKPGEKFEFANDKVEEVIVETMHERKVEMARRVGGFVGLPGGYGTFEEFFEVITWTQIGVHRKPVVLLNIRGYYDHIRGMILKAVEEGFIQPGTENYVIFVDGPKDYDKHESFDWGKAALDAIDSWDYDHESFYRFDWSKAPTPRGESPMKLDSVDKKLAYT